MLFKNYSLTEVIYLLIRFNKTKFFPRNTKTTDRNDVNKLNTHAHTKHSKKDNTGGRGGSGGVSNYVYTNYQMQGTGHGQELMMTYYIYLN